MNVKSIKCPECGANLDVEEDRTTCFCSYCGSKISVVDRVIHYRHTDDANVLKAEAELKRTLADIELEKEEREFQRSEGNKPLLIFGGFIILMFVFIMIMSFLEK